MPCRLCIERGKPANFGSDPQCGFDVRGVFTTDNWMCATLLKLREMAENSVLDVYDLRSSPDARYGARWRAGDSSLAVIDMPHPEYPDSNTTAWIVMSWYKDRGRTGQAWFFHDEDPPRPLTIDDAELAITLSPPVRIISPSDV